MKKEDYIYGMNWIGQMQEAYAHTTRYPTVEYALNFHSTVGGMICHAATATGNHDEMWFTRFQAASAMNLR